MLHLFWGFRFPELAVGVYQPNHVRPGVVYNCSKEDSDGCNATRKLNNAHGEIFKFRMSLWREHLNRLEPVMADPWSEECSRFEKVVFFFVHPLERDPAFLTFCRQSRIPDLT